MEQRPVRRLCYALAHPQMLAAFLGAGFSRWASDLPVAAELFDFNIRTRGRREHRRAELVQQDWVRWRDVNPGQPAELFVGWALQQSANCRKRVVWYVTRRLSDPFLCRILGGTATFQIDDRRARELPGVRRGQRLLQHFLGAGLSGIVTSNYDLLIEYALTTRNFTYGIPGERLYGRGANPMFPWQGSNPALRGHLPVAKLHGSVSWNFQRRYTDGRRGLSGTALIVPPGPEKTPPSELAATWELARGILSKADRLVVFGFGFNLYDQALPACGESRGSGLAPARSSPYTERPWRWARDRRRAKRRRCGWTRRTFRRVTGILASSG